MNKGTLIVKDLKIEDQALQNCSEVEQEISKSFVSLLSKGGHVKLIQNELKFWNEQHHLTFVLKDWI